MDHLTFMLLLWSGISLASIGAAVLIAVADCVSLPREPDASAS